MKPLYLPAFCSSLSTKWPFPNTLDNIVLYHCMFNKTLFTDTDYQLSGIEFPLYLTKAINKRKAEYLAGRICAQEALKQLNVMGYPQLNDDKSPLWPSSSCGSISHSHQTVAAIVARQSCWQNIGLDIEQLINITRSERLLNTVTSDKEQQLMGDDISLFTTLAFSIKESLFKALYPITHQYFYFKDAEIIAWTKEGKVMIRLLTTLSGEWQKNTVLTGQFCLKEHNLWSLVVIPAHQNKSQTPVVV